MAGEELKSYRKKQWWVSGCGCGDGGGVRGVRAGGGGGGIRKPRSGGPPARTPASYSTLVHFNPHTNLPRSCSCFCNQCSASCHQPDGGAEAAGGAGQKRGGSGAQPEDWGE